MKKNKKYFSVGRKIFALILILVMVTLISDFVNYRTMRANNESSHTISDVRVRDMLDVFNISNQLQTLQKYFYMLRELHQSLNSKN